MRFLAGSSQLAADERVTCSRQDGRRKGGPTPAIALQAKALLFGWQVLVLTAVLVVAAAILGAPAARGEPLVREADEREVSHASAV